MFRKYWTLLDSYILKKFLSTFVFAIIIIALIACVIDYSEKVDDFVKNKPGGLQILWYYICFIPQISALLFPLFIFIATIFFTSKMAYRTEIIAILASGVSYTRFLRPYVVGGCILGGVSMLGNHIVVPLASQEIREFHIKYIWNDPFSTDRNIHLRLSPTEYVFIQNFDYSNLEMSKFTIETIVDNKVIKKISADKGFYDTLTNEWLLKRVMIRTFDSLAIPTANLEMQHVPISTQQLNIAEHLEEHREYKGSFGLTPEVIINDDRVKETLTTPELLTEIENQKIRGTGTLNAFMFELYKRSAQPFAGLVLCIIGACLASKKVRGGSGLHLAIGIAGSAIYMLFLQFSQTFTINAGVNPLISMWIPNMLFSIIAWIMYRRNIR